MATRYGSPGKTFGETETAFGGGLVVFDGIKDTVRYPFGATLVDTVSEGDIITAGFPVALNKVLKTVTLCNCFRVYEATAGGYTTVKVSKYPNLATVTALDELMKCPTTPTGTSTGISVTAVDATAETYDVLTVSADAFGALVVGDILVYADATGAGASQVVVATDFIGDNIIIGENDNAADKCIINDVIFETSIMKHRLPPYPPYMELASVSGQRYMFNEE